MRPLRFVFLCCTYGLAHLHTELVLILFWQYKIGYIINDSEIKTHIMYGY